MYLYILFDRLSKFPFRWSCLTRGNSMNVTMFAFMYGLSPCAWDWSQESPFATFSPFRRVVTLRGSNSYIVPQPEDMGILHKKFYKINNSKLKNVWAWEVLRDIFVTRLLFHCNSMPYVWQIFARDDPFIKKELKWSQGTAKLMRSKILCHMFSTENQQLLHVYSRPQKLSQSLWVIISSENRI